MREASLLGCHQNGPVIASKIKTHLSVTLLPQPKLEEIRKQKLQTPKRTSGKLFP
jgi:hypothetical protein